MDIKGAGAAVVAHARTFRHATMVPPVASMGSDTMMRVSGANCVRGIIKYRNAASIIPPFSPPLLRTLLQLYPCISY